MGKVEMSETPTPPSFEDDSTETVEVPAPVEPKIEEPKIEEPKVEEPKQEAPKRGRGKAADEKPQAGPGRIVMYVTNSETIRPAIISRVNADDTVDLSVFNSEGCVAVTNVNEADVEDEIPGTYHWPVR